MYFHIEDTPVRVLRWDAETSPEGVFMYATMGVSTRPAEGHSPDHRLEYFVGLLPPQDDAALAFAQLAAVTWNEPMDHGHTVEMDGPLWPGTDMNCWLVTTPLVEIVPPLLHDGLHVQWLMAIPLYPSERTWKAVHGLEALVSQWEAEEVPYWDPHRPLWTGGS